VTSVAACMVLSLKHYWISFLSRTIRYPVNLVQKILLWQKCS